MPAGAAPTVASATATEVPAIKAVAPALPAPGVVTAVQRTSGPAVLVTYRADSSPDPVTGKVIHLAVERYEFWKGGKEAILTLSGPVGADNVDPWKTVTDSFALAVTPAVEAGELYRFFHARRRGDAGPARRVPDGRRGRARRGHRTFRVGQVDPPRLPGRSRRARRRCRCGSAGHVLSRRPEVQRAGCGPGTSGCCSSRQPAGAPHASTGNIALATASPAAATRPAAAELLGHARARPPAPTPDRAQLSGGESARAGLAVALANEPQVLLADEPTGEVDHATEDRILAPPARAAPSRRRRHRRHPQRRGGRRRRPRASSCSTDGGRMKRGR